MNNSVVRKVQTSFYESIPYNDVRFTNGSMVGQSYFGDLGDGATGMMRVGTMVLYTTSQGNHGKFLVTGIDKDVQIAGAWRLHLDWTTWNSGGTLVSRGSNLMYVATDVSNQFLELDSGITTNDFNVSEMRLFAGGVVTGCLSNSTFIVYQ